MGSMLWSCRGGMEVSDATPGEDAQTPRNGGAEGGAADTQGPGAGMADGRSEDAATAEDDRADGGSGDTPTQGDRRADAGLGDATTQRDDGADGEAADAPTEGEGRADGVADSDISDATVSEDGGATPPPGREACTSVPTMIGSIGGLAPVQGIAVDGPYIYLADAQRGAIRRMDLNGNVETLAVADLADSVRLDGSALYWKQLVGISTMPASGGTSTLLVAERFNGEGAFTLDSTYLYWVSTSAGTVSKILRTGGGRVELAAGIDQPTSIGVDASHAYVTSYGGGNVLRIAVAGGSPVSYASGMMVPDALVVHATGVYWGNRSAGGIMRMPLGGGTPETFDSGHSPQALVFRGDVLYWLSYSTSGFVRKVPLDGSLRSEIATDIPLARSLAVSDNCVYWADLDGAIMYVRR
jgi:hypothetical protein